MSYTTEELITILNSLPIAVIVIDEDRLIVQANRSTLQFSGKTMEDILGKKGGDVFNCPHINDHADGCGYGPRCKGCSLKNAVADTLRTGEPIKRLQFAMELMDSTMHDLMITTNVATLQGKKVVLLAIEDITDLKQQESLKIKQVQLTTALETVGGMSHELSQPLMVILGFADLLKNSFGDSEHARHLNMIYECSLRLKDTVHNLQRIVDYKNKAYVNGKIIDINESTKKEDN